MKHKLLDLFECKDVAMILHRQSLIGGEVQFCHSAA